MDLICKDNLAEYMAGGIAAVAKSDSTTLENIMKWMSEQAGANKVGKVKLAKALELSCPTVANCDEALDELTARIKMPSEPKYRAYTRALESTAGKELYGLRDALTRAGSDGSAYSAAWDRERQNSRGHR